MTLSTGLGFHAILLLQFYQLCTCWILLPHQLDEACSDEMAQLHHVSEMGHGWLGTCSVGRGAVLLSSRLRHWKAGKP